MVRKNLLGKVFVTLLAIPSVISVTFWIIVSSYSHLLGMNSKSINIAKHPIHSRVSVKISINNFPGQGSSHPVYVVTIIQPGFNQKIGTVSKLEKDVEELTNKHDNAQDYPIKFAWSLDGKRLGASSLGRYIVVWDFNSMTVWKNVADSLEDLNTVHNWFERYLEQPFDLWEEQVKYKKLLIHNYNF